MLPALSALPFGAAGGTGTDRGATGLTSLPTALHPFFFFPFKYPFSVRFFPF